MCSAAQDAILRLRFQAYFGDRTASDRPAQNCADVVGNLNRDYFNETTPIIMRSIVSVIGIGVVLITINACGTHGEGNYRL